MFIDMRARLAGEGFAYLSDNNVLRYLNSYLWNFENAHMRLVNTERWRRENDCMEIRREEVINEINMKVSNCFIIPK